MTGWLDVPRGWLDSLGEITRFGLRVAGLVYSGRAFRFFGEALRQAGILILGSALIIWAFVFILGLQCGLQGAYFFRAQGVPSYAGLFAAFCDLREALPYAFGYILSAKVGTGIVAELGAMRISDELDALEVMGVPPVTFLCAGVGVALVSSRLGNERFAQGSLVKLFDRELETGESYYLILRREDAERPNVKALTQWLIEEFSVAA